MSNLRFNVLNAASAKFGRATGWGEPSKAFAHPTLFMANTESLDRNKMLSVSPLLNEVLKRERNIKKYRLKKLWFGFEQVML